MVSEDNEEPLPIIQTLDLDKLKAIRDTLGLGADDLPPDNLLPPVEKRKRGRPRTIFVDTNAPKRPRGRPRKHPVSETGTVIPELAEEEAARVGGTIREGSPLPPVKLGKRDEKEVSERIANMLLAGTGIASQAKSYLAMTEEEAKAISDPLSSYLVRNVETIPIAGQILENYDLLAIVLGVLAYTVRIYRDRSNELSEQRANRVNNSPTLSRIDQLTGSPYEGQAERNDDFISAPFS